MDMFNSYVKLPEGIYYDIYLCVCTLKYYHSLLSSIEHLVSAGCHRFLLRPPRRVLLILNHSEKLYFINSVIIASLGIESRTCLKPLSNHISCVICVSFPWQLQYMPTLAAENMSKHVVA